MSHTQAVYVVGSTKPRLGLCVHKQGTTPPHFRCSTTLEMAQVSYRLVPTAVTTSAKYEVKRPSTCTILHASAFMCTLQYRYKLQCAGLGEGIDVVMPVFTVLDLYRLSCNGQTNKCQPLRKLLCNIYLSTLHAQVSPNVRYHRNQRMTNQPDL